MLVGCLLGWCGDPKFVFRAESALDVTLMH